MGLNDMRTLKKKPKRGRPTRAESVRRKAKATLVATDIINTEPVAFDPRKVLREIAGDPAMPPTARVAAARALIGAEDPTDDAGTGAGDALTRRATQLLIQATKGRPQ